MNLTESIEEALSNLQASIEQTNAKIESSDLPSIEGDPDQMIQLFQNLVGNAIKFHQKDKPPKVKISGQIVSIDPEKTMKSDRMSNRDYCRILVEDNGIGFDEKFVERIFLPFQRLHGRFEYEGSGMGLAICRKIITRHGGAITAQSRPGSGTAFIFTLPLKQKKQPEMTTETSTII